MLKLESFLKQRRRKKVFNHLHRKGNRCPGYVNIGLRKLTNTPDESRKRNNDKWKHLHGGKILPLHRKQEVMFGQVFVEGIVDVSFNYLAHPTEHRYRAVVIAFTSVS